MFSKDNCKLDIKTSQNRIEPDWQNVLEKKYSLVSIQN